MFSLIAYRIDGAHTLDLIPAPRQRAWMDATTGRFANRCLPLLMANAAGWWLTSRHDLVVEWNGGDAIADLSIGVRGGQGPCPAASHFGHGILTFHIPFLFRTPPGWNLLARGPANCPRMAAHALEGLIESDGRVAATFTVNWILLAPHYPVVWRIGEPIAQLVPMRRGDLERFAPEIRDLDSDPQLATDFRLWADSRRRFNADLREPNSAAVKAGWQKDYFRACRESKLELRPFEEKP